MKISRLFFAISSILALLASCKSSAPIMDKTVSYLDHSLVIPTDWTYETKELNGGAAHQIMCGNKSGSQLFTIRWQDKLVDLPQYAELVRGLFKDQRMFGNAALMASANSVFQDQPASYFEFSGSYQDFRYAGRVMVFNANSRTYCICYYADVDEASQSMGEPILNSVKLP